MDAFVRDLARTVQLADIADILLVAAFFFVGITWLRRSSSGSAARRIMALCGLLAVVYLLADIVHLYLVRQLLQLLSIAFLIAAVVVFQSDIRRLLDRIGAWGDPRRQEAQAGGSTVDTLIEAANRLAEDRVGAIIALRGRDSLDPHVQGGVELDGLVSRPLLESIFQPESAGHDGAVLMEGDRVVRFAAHLPLASQIPEVSRYGGTRHAAALGLADETDAFVLVISEERGTISVAEDSTLTEMSSLSELSQRLTRFWNEHYTDSGEGKPEWRSRTTLETATMSVGFAMLTWLLFSFSADTISRTFEVPIEFRNLPPEWALESDSVPSALVTLSGSEQAFSRLDSGELVISFDLSQPDSGLNVLTITGENLALPSGLELADVRPREIRVEAQPQMAVDLPIQVRTRPASADTLQLVTEPRTVTVLHAEGVTPPAVIPTEPIDLVRLLRRGTSTASLNVPPGVRLAPDEAGEVVVVLRRRAPTPSR